MQVVQSDHRLQKLKEIEDSFKDKPHNKLYIWGCCETASFITEYCQNNSALNVAAYIVDDEYYTIANFRGKTVISRSQWETIVNEGDYVWIGFINFHRAKQIIHELPKGVEGIYYLFPMSIFIDGSTMTYDYFLQYADRYHGSYEMMSDQLSKRLFESFINSSISGEADTIENMHDPEQYFNDLTQGFMVKSYVDCGAYIGDTVESALDFYSNSLENIIAFEPDQHNLHQLGQTLDHSNLSQDNYRIIPKGVWSLSGTLLFSSTGETSSVNACGDVQISVDSIDHVVEESQEMISTVDFIKMDIEGSEKEALLGARDTIQKYHPILAISIYHKKEDLYELPETLSNIAGDSYQFYLRYHGQNLRDLVLYAIPKEVIS